MPQFQKSLESISLSGTQKTEFTVGGEFSTEGLVVTAHYSDDSSETIALSNFTITGYDMNTAGWLSGWRQIPRDSQADIKALDVLFTMLCLIAIT